MTKDEIIDLIRHSPENLVDFFNESILLYDKDVPNYGTIQGRSCAFVLLPNIDLNSEKIISTRLLVNN